MSDEKFTCMAGCENGKPWGYCADDLGCPHVQRQLAILGVAQTATEEFLALQLGLRTIEQLKANLEQSVYWREFCVAAKAGTVPDDWLLGALGRVVLGWAKL